MVCNALGVTIASTLQTFAVKVQWKCRETTVIWFGLQWSTACSFSLYSIAGKNCNIIHYFSTAISTIFHCNFFFFPLHFKKDENFSKMFFIKIWIFPFSLPFDLQTWSSNMILKYVHVVFYHFPLRFKKDENFSKMFFSKICILSFSL